MPPFFRPMMFWLGLILPVVYIPSITGAIIPSGWVFLSAVLPLLLWNRTQMSWPHGLLFAFITYAALSLAWTPNPLSGIETLWHWGVFAMAFCIGTRLEDTEDLFKGLGLGMALNALVAILGLAKVVMVPSVAIYPAQAALFFNPNMLGEASAIILVGIVVHRLWHLIPGPAICLALSQSRLGIAAVFAMAAIYLVPKAWRPLTLIAGAAIIAGLFWHKDGLTAVTVRTDIWTSAWPYLNFFGNGVGSLLMETKYGMVEHLHNDFLEAWFELGIGSLLLLTVLAWAAIRDPMARPILACTAIIGFASFPLYLPVTGFVVGVVAGAAHSHVRLALADRLRSRLAVSARMAKPRLRVSNESPADLPVQLALSTGTDKVPT